MVRHLYEQTDASLGEIAIDLRVHKDTVRRLAKRGGWSRYVRPPRALSTAAQLVVQTSELEAKVSGEAVATRRAPSDAEKSRGAAVQLQAEESQTIVDASAAMPELTDTVARLYRAVLEELAAVEALRAQLRREPQSRHGAERTARTLSSLTETLQKLQRLARPGWERSGCERSRSARALTPTNARCRSHWLAKPSTTCAR